MAVYEYEILAADGSPRGIYEVEQRMSDPVLTHHPETGEPLRRILSSTFARTSAEGPVGSCASGACGIPSGGCGSGACGFN